ncbi:hypothetical protein BHE74_00015241 [Ensete ventricosum]|nr:hypothetical protein BHE74_00015241 [Ensete ventricosum]
MMVWDRSIATHYRPVTLIDTRPQEQDAPTIGAMREPHEELQSRTQRHGAQEREVRWLRCGREGEEKGRRGRREEEKGLRSSAFRRRGASVDKERKEEKGREEGRKEEKGSALCLPHVEIEEVRCVREEKEGEEEEQKTGRRRGRREGIRENRKEAAVRAAAGR